MHPFLDEDCDVGSDYGDVRTGSVVEDRDMAPGPAPALGAPVDRGMRWMKYDEMNMP